MKRTLLGAVLICCHYSLYCCSFSPPSFCETINLHPDNVVISGIVIATDNFGIDMQVIEVLRGVEDRPVIRIWNGTDFECNGHFSLSALGIGHLYDTVVIMLPKIVAKENYWDVPGDYRRPNPHTETPELDVEGGIALGFISGDYWAPIEYSITTVDYDTLIHDLLTNGECASILSGNKDVDADLDIHVNNPFRSTLIVQLAKPLYEASMSIYALNGSISFEKQIDAEQLIQLDVQGLPPGIYILQVQSAEGRAIRKIVKPQDG